jgi:endonuclease YncB( thermonuclease family)
MSALVLGLLLMCASMTTAWAEPVVCSGINVIDGDTIRHHGRTYRLVDFDAPEIGRRARCESEGQLAQKASDRLKGMLLSTDTCDLTEIRCSCRKSTIGTTFCNHNRLCGRLTVDGRDVGRDILVPEGLARPFHCSATRCPKLRSWCA